MDFIPVNEPLLNGNEKKYLCECIDTGWISSEGPFVKEFEAKMTDYKKTLADLFAKGAELEKDIQESLERLKYE